MLTHLRDISIVQNFGSRLVTYPEDQVRILAVPAVTPVVGKETPGKPVIFVLHEDAYASSVARAVAHVLFPNDRQEQRSS